MLRSRVSYLALAAVIALPASAAFKTGEIGSGSFTAASALGNTLPNLTEGCTSNCVTPAVAQTVASALAGGSSLSVSDGDAIAFADTDGDGDVDGNEFIAILSAAGLTGVNSSSNGLWARAYAEEMADLTTPVSQADLQAAITAGNSWTVNAPSITTTTASFTGTDSSHSAGLGISDGAGVALAGAADGQVTTTVSATHSSGVDFSSSFAVDSDGNLEMASGTSVQDLDAGTYTITVTAQDSNTDTYGKSASQDITLTVSNENGCILNNGITAGGFNAGASSIEGGAVTISGNFNSNDLLFVKGATSTTIAIGKRYTNFGYSGITAEYSTSGGVLRFYGTTTEANWVEIFKKVGYIYNSSGSASQNTRSLVFSMSNKVPYAHTDGGWRFYEYIANEDVNFDTIMDDIDDSGYTSSSDTHYLFGLKPYLATITSSDEQAYIRPKIQGQGWIGGCDNLAGSGTRAACNVGDGEFDSDTDRTDGQPFQNAWRNEGEWVWVTGPERGIPFGTDNNTGCTSGHNWTANNSAYENWHAGHEPNNCNHEHHLHVLGNGEWNDYNYHDDRINGYIVEWGGPTNDSTYGQVGGNALDLTETKSYNMSTEGQFCAHQ